MIIASPTIIDMINSPARTIKGRVEIYKGSTLAFTLKGEDALKSFTVTRAGEEGKFFGFGISQKLELHILDTQRALTIDKDDSFKVYLGVDEEFISTYPTFDTPEITRDENTNELTITAHDLLDKARGITVIEMPHPTGATVADWANSCALALGAAGIKIEGFSSEDTPFNLSYVKGANVEGQETIKSLLNAIAEVTQTIYFVNNSGYLVFKRLNKNDNPVLSITKNKYFELKTQAAHTLTKLIHVTELGENQESTGEGEAQIIRDNLFWTLLEADEAAAQLEAALASITGLSIAPFECKWRGDFRLEVGDKVELITKDNNSAVSYLLNDVMEYTGALSSTSKWAYQEDTSETHTNPTTLGAALNQTFAKVDKINQEISLVAETANANKEAVSQLLVDTEGVLSKVSSMETKVNDSNNKVEVLAQSVEQKVTAEQVSIAIKAELDNGVEKVTTETGYTFDENGLTISKSNRDMTTRITEDGMTVYRNADAVLVANNEGVNAENLHATTYLKIGGRSRFENYESNRTGCFWIGGND